MGFHIPNVRTMIVLMSFPFKWMIRVGCLTWENKGGISELILSCTLALYEYVRMIGQESLSRAPAQCGANHGLGLHWKILDLCASVQARPGRVECRIEQGKIRPPRYAHVLLVFIFGRDLSHDHVTFHMADYCCFSRAILGVSTSSNSSICIRHLSLEIRKNSPSS